MIDNEYIWLGYLQVLFVLDLEAEAEDSEGVAEGQRDPPGFKVSA